MAACLETKIETAEPRLSFVVSKPREERSLNPKRPGAAYDAYGDPRHRHGLSHCRTECTGISGIGQGCFGPGQHCLLSPYNIVYERYKLLCCIGTGSHGDVWLATNIQRSKLSRESTLFLSPP